MPVGGAYANKGRLSSVGVARRLQGLMAAGWPAITLTEELSVTGSHFFEVLFHARGVNACGADFAVRVAVLFDDLQATPGPCERTARQAREFGFAMPFIWNEDDMDKPEIRDVVVGADVEIPLDDRVDPIVLDELLANTGIGAKGVSLERRDRSVYASVMLDLGYTVTHVARAMKLGGAMAKVVVDEDAAMRAANSTATVAA